MVRLYCLYFTLTSPTYYLATSTCLFLTRSKKCPTAEFRRFKEPVTFHNVSLYKNFFTTYNITTGAYAKIFNELWDISVFYVTCCMHA